MYLALKVLQHIKDSSPAIIFSNSSRPRGYKTFYMLNSADHEILNAHKNKNIKKFSLFMLVVFFFFFFAAQKWLKCQQLLAF